MARTTRNAGINQVPLSEIKDDPSRYVREAEAREFDYRLENDPRFLQRIEQARASLRAGLGVRLEDLETE
jgi:hypothetical protein